MNFKNKYTHIIVVLVILFVTQITIAQDAPQSVIEDLIGFDQGVDDTAEAPIHFLIPFFMLIGAYLGIKKLRR